MNILISDDNIIGVTGDGFGDGDEYGSGSGFCLYRGDGYGYGGLGNYFDGIGDGYGYGFYLTADGSGYGSGDKHGDGSGGGFDVFSRKY